MFAHSPDIGADASWPVEATHRMNRMYRRQRHFYDATRRYCLLGRDQLIANLQPEAGAAVLEIGCGTGRNLVLAAGLYPQARFFGIDVSTEMLTSAISNISRHDLEDRIRVAHGDATIFEPHPLFGIKQFDHVLVCYSLSMIPSWRRVLERAVSRLKPGGRLHIVDFGSQEQMPTLARTLLRRWLSLFDVTPRDELESFLSTIAKRTGAGLRFERWLRDYTHYAVLTLPRKLPMP